MAAATGRPAPVDPESDRRADLLRGGGGQEQRRGLRGVPELRVGVLRASRDRQRRRSAPARCRTSSARRRPSPAAAGWCAPDSPPWAPRHSAGPGATLNGFSVGIHASDDMVRADKLDEQGHAIARMTRAGTAFCVSNQLIEKTKNALVGNGAIRGAPGQSTFVGDGAHHGRRRRRSPGEGRRPQTEAPERRQVGSNRAPSPSDQLRHTGHPDGHLDLSEQRHPATI